MVVVFIILDWIFVLMDTATMMNHGSCIHHLGLDICLNGYNYHDSLQASYSEMCLQGIRVVVFIILDWIFVLMNITTMIPCRRESQKKMAMLNNNAIFI